VTDLLALAGTLPRRTLAEGERLMRDGDPGGTLYVLLDGTLRVEKSGVPITTLTQPGACVGEMSLLLDVPVTADVVAAGASTVAVAEHARDRIATDGALALALARILAARLQSMTGYLADLKRQYADHGGGLAMIDTVLGSLMRADPSPTRLMSERDPDPEF
jgi:CRP-like cAMP-binding protein